MSESVSQSVSQSVSDMGRLWSDLGPIKKRGMAVQTETGKPGKPENCLRIPNSSSSRWKTCLQNPSRDMDYWHNNVERFPDVIIWMDETEEFTARVTFRTALFKISPSINSCCNLNWHGKTTNNKNYKIILSSVNFSTNGSTQYIMSTNHHHLFYNKW